jgi:hypothetical protein
MAQTEKIALTKSLKEANRVAREMPEEVTSAAIKDWSRVCKEVQDQCAALLGPLAIAADSISAPLDPDLHSLTVPDSGPGEEFKHDYMTMLRGAVSGGMMLGGAATAANLVLTNGIMAALATPAAVFAAPAVILLTGIGIGSVRKAELRNTQQQLTSRLRELLLRVHRHFFDVDLASGRLSLVDEYFKTLERTMNEQIGDLVQQRSREANAEIARLTEAAKLDDQQREAQSKRIRKQLAEWDEIGKATKNTMTLIKALKEARVTPQPGPAAVGKG